MVESSISPTQEQTVRFLVSIPEEAVKLVFGFMGTHIQMGSVFFQLSEKWKVDSLGRKILVKAPTTRAAALAVLSFIYELTHVTVSAASGWMYVDPNNQVHGPYVSSRITTWLKKKYFDAQFPVLLANPVVAIWIPAFMVEALTEIFDKDDDVTRMETEFVSMRDDDPAMDWEGAEDDVAMARQHIGGRAVGEPNGAAPGVVSKALESVVHQHAREAMDYDVCDYNVFGQIEKTVHVCVVLDTNVLLSHFSFLERRFGDIVFSQSKRGNVVSLILVVPWIVLCELDHLKEGRLRDTALYAIKRIHTLASARDSHMYVQGSASHKQMAKEVALIDGQNHSLRNDDFIMQACVYFEKQLVKKLREKKHRAHCVLISNDRGLQLRARANSIACMKAVEVEGNIDAFLDVVDRVVPHEDVTVEVQSVIRQSPDPSKSGSSTNGTPKPRSTSMRPTEHPAQHVSKEVEDFLASLQLQGSVPDLSGDRPHVRGVNQRHQIRDMMSSMQSTLSTTKMPIASSTAAPLPVVTYAVQHGLGAFVRYLRQQDLGDLWDDLLEDELKWPGWEAGDVLKVLTRHSSTFWSVFDRHLLDDAKTLLRYLHPSRFDAHAHECTIIARKLLHAAYEAFSKPLTDTDAPDPATICGFLSLGDARAAVTESIEKLSEY